MEKNTSKKTRHESTKTSDESRFGLMERVAYGLHEKYGVVFDEFIYKGEVGRTEYLLHEVAHWLTLDLGNRDFTKLPKALTAIVGEEVGKFSIDVQDALELDALYVEYVAGKRLGLWRNKQLLVDAGKNALIGWSKHRISHALYLREVTYTLGDSRHLTTIGRDLANWFENNLKEMK